MLAAYNWLHWYHGKMPPLCLLLYSHPATFAYVNQSTAFVARKGHYYQHSWEQNGLTNWKEEVLWRGKDKGQSRELDSVVWVHIWNSNCCIHFYEDCSSDILGLMLQFTKPCYMIGGEYREVGWREKCSSWWEVWRGTSFQGLSIYGYIINRKRIQLNESFEIKFLSFSTQLHQVR